MKVEQQRISQPELSIILPSSIKAMPGRSCTVNSEEEKFCYLPAQIQLSLHLFYRDPRFSLS